MAIQLVTVDQFLEKAGLQSVDVPNPKAIEEFIHNIDLDEYIFEAIPAGVLKKYAEHLQSNEPISYNHIFDELPATALNDHKLQDLSHVAVIQMERGIAHSLLIDYKLNKAYFSLHGIVLDDVCYAEKDIFLSNELISFIENELTNANLPSTGAEYTGDMNYRFYTALLLAFDDGIIRYSSRGLNSNMPSTVFHVCRQLIMKFAKA